MKIALQRFWKRRPLFFLAVLMVAVLCSDAWLPWFSWVLIAGVFLLVRSVGNWKVGLFVGVVAVSLVSAARWQVLSQERSEQAFSEYGSRQVEARLTEDAVGETGRWSAVARLYGEDYEGRKVRWAGSGEVPPAGTWFKAHGVFEGFKKQRNPGLEGRAERLRNEGVVAIFRASEMREERWIGPVSKMAARFKSAFREGIIEGLEPGSEESKVIRAVVIGERSPDSLELLRNFRHSGTLHVFTVSGMHVMMVGSMIWFVLKWAGVRRRWAVPVIIATMFGYAWLSGNGPAALRAAWMGAVFLVAYSLRRRPDLLNSLGAVLLASLIWNPAILRMPGVQLSYGVVAAIGLLTVFVRWFFVWISREEELLPSSEIGWLRRRWTGFRKKLAEALAVSMAAWIGSAPLSMFHFKLVTPVSVIATVVLVAQVYVLLPVALFSAVLHPFSRSASAWLNRGNAKVARSCVGTARFFSSLPGAWIPAGFPEKDSLLIYDLDYGAASACFTSSTGSAVLIDTGGKFNMEFEIGTSLRNLGILPDSLIYTHADAGHVVDPALLNGMFRMRQIVGLDLRAKGSIASAWKEISMEDVKLVRPMTGDFMDLGGGVRAKVLHSPFSQEGGSVADDRVLVFLMEWHGWRVLWLGDAGRMTEEVMLKSGVDLEADVIVAGCHESDLSLTEDFLKAVNPQAIVIPRPPGSGVDPYRLVLRERWEKMGILTIDQKQTGGLTVKAQEDEMVFEGYLDDSKTRLKQR